MTADGSECLAEGSAQQTSASDRQKYPWQTELTGSITITSDLRCGFRFEIDDVNCSLARVEHDHAAIA